MDGIKLKLNWKEIKGVKVMAMYCFKRCDYRQH